MSVRIRNIQLRYIDKSATIDKKHGKEKFEKLIEIIKESGLYLVHEGGESYHIKIPGTKAEIEIFSTYNSFYPKSFVHIQLWMYDFF